MVPFLLSKTQPPEGPVALLSGGFVRVLSVFRTGKPRNVAFGLFEKRRRNLQAALEPAEEKQAAEIGASQGRDVGGAREVGL